ncbi:hypothetical protein [Methylotuvimicrobium alcaliphilum]|uniref:hypothetical protein n=1 Tax=Methylotuvimicrobium alcaliphilum TaxID=271065 RepID=UPI001CC262FF|nr:hypothetical protein [Methylotuvimicrobium alcaliphilum]
MNHLNRPKQLHCVSNPTTIQTIQMALNFVGDVPRYRMRATRLAPQQPDLQGFFRYIPIALQISALAYGGVGGFGKGFASMELA